MARVAGRESGFECLAQPVGVNAPEVVLFAVDECDRNLLSIRRHQRGVVDDIDRFPADSQLGTQLFDRRLGHFAQMTSGFGVDDDAGLSHDP